MSFEALLEAVVRKVVREELDARPAATARPELLTYEQAAELVGVGVSTVKEWVKSGTLPVYAPPATGAAASSRRVRPADVVALFRRVDAKVAPQSDLDPARQAQKILARAGHLRRVR